MRRRLFNHMLIGETFGLPFQTYYVVFTSIKGVGMHASNAKRFSLALCIAFLILTAAVAIISVFSGSFGDVQLKILATTFSISTASICSMSCAAFMEHKNDKKLGLVGIAFSILATIMVISGIWIEIEVFTEKYWKTTISLIVLSIAFAHAFLLLLPKLNPEHRWVQTASVIGIGLLAFMICMAMWGEIDDGGFYKLLVVNSILVVLCTLVIPICMRMRREEIDVTKKVQEILVLTKQDDGTYVDKEGKSYQVLPVAQEEDTAVEK